MTVSADHTLELRLRRPARPARDRPTLTPEVAGCELAALAPAVDPELDDDLERWRGRCGPGGPAAIELRGLDLAGFDVVVDLRVDGRGVHTALLRPAAPALRLGPRAAPSLLAYLRLGVDHILGGLDHLLFVVGLVVLVCARDPRPRRAALRTAGVLTGFTLAHSLTLAAAALGWLVIDPAPVEACIALSLVLLARALALADPPGRLWAFAAACGLLHGLGFAGALIEVGLPAGAVVPALLAFNGGVELGQIAVAGVVLAVFVALARSRVGPRVAPAIALVLGALAVALLLDRALVLAGRGA